jgi:hypothetical protein
VNGQKIALEELDSILKSERLTKVFDVLEPKAQRLSKQPIAISYSILFGSLFLAISSIVGYLAVAQLHFPTTLMALVVIALTTTGLCLGNLVSVGKEGRRLERRGRAIEKFVRPLLPLIAQTNRRVITKDLGKNLTETVMIEIDHSSPPKQIGAPREEVVVE